MGRIKISKQKFDKIGINIKIIAGTNYAGKSRWDTPPPPNIPLFIVCKYMGQYLGHRFICQI